MPTSSTKRHSRPSRIGLGTLSVFQIVLFLAVVIFANYIASHYSYHADFSRAGDFTLSSSTKNFLGSEALSKRGRPVKWVMVFRRSAPFYERIRSLAEEYARLSDEKIELEIIDPLRSPDRASQFAAEYQITMVRDLILIDARPNQDIPIVTQSKGASPALNSHITIALAEEMLSYTMDENEQRRPSALRAEDLMTARLVEATEGRQRSFLFFADKSRFDFEEENSALGNLASTLRYQNIRLTAANVSELSALPENVEGIAIVAPKYDFTDQEIDLLDRYWQQPRASLLILLEPGECPPNLRTFLRAKGITPRRDRVIAQINQRLTTHARGTFSRGISFLKDLAGQAVVFEGASSSLEVREGAEDLAVKKIAPMPLISVADGHWGEMDFGKKSAESFDPIRDIAAPLHIAAAVTRGASNDDRYAAETSRMVVLSNTDFLQTDRQRAENVDFLASSANWLIRREALTGNSPRTIGIYMLPLLDAQVSFLNRLNLVFAPLAFLIVGGIVFSTRRA
jgi:hypothetical protein